jgi:hypothetical protein
VVGTTVLPAGPAESVPVDPSCPPAADESTLAPGQPVDGLTVSHGTSPDTFTGDVVGVLLNGIAAGLDLIIVKLQGSVITDPGTGAVDRGIWEGMSGSPVYDADGNLIGAVSYGLSYSPSDYAGVTPAAAMYAIQNHLAGKRLARHVPITGAVAHAMSADTTLSTDAVADGFRRLPMPFAVSGGFSTKKVREIARRGGLNPKRFVAGVSAGASPVSIPVEAGGSLVGSAAYGDIDLTGTGTATAVCNGNIIGFGHPFLFTGTSDLTLHGADTLYIQPGGIDPSFKVSVAGAPLGAFTQDRLAGVIAAQGHLPPTTVIDTTLTNTDDGAWRHGTTSATTPDYLGYAAALHTYLNLLNVFDEVGAGTTDLTWTIDLSTAGNKNLSMTRSTKTASQWSAAEEPVYSLWSDIERILGNRFADVRITSVNVTGTITTELQQLTISGVERRVGSTWVTVRNRSQVRVAPGSVLHLRVSLDPTRHSTSAPQRVRIDLTVPARLRGAFGEGIVAGDGFDPNRGAKATSLADYLAQLSARPGNEVVSAALRFRHPAGASSGSATAKAPVSGRFLFDVRVTK